MLNFLLKKSFFWKKYFLEINSLAGKNLFFEDHFFSNFFEIFFIENQLPFECCLGKTFSWRIFFKDKIWIFLQKNMWNFFEKIFLAKNIFLNFFQKFFWNYLRKLLEFLEKSCLKTFFLNKKIFFEIFC